MKKEKEAETEFFVEEGIFYNEYMKLSREISYLVIKHLGELRILDAFSASGIRGILYKKKNENVKEISFLDYSKRAVENIKRNLDYVGVEGEVHKEEFNKFICNTKNDYNFIELDPFGSPTPYLYNALKYLSKKKESYISLTATDLQVLCGIQREACKKFYQSNARSNYFCHETGLRILIKKVGEVAAEFNLAIEPIVSFYYRHQMKTILKLKKDSKKAYEIVNSFQYLCYEPKTMEIKICEGDCNKKCLGPIWSKELHNKEIIYKALNSNTKKSNIAEKMLSLFIEENDYPPFYYSSHRIAKMLKINPHSMEKIIKKFKESGYKIGRTHFSGEAFKTDTNIGKITKIFKEMR